MNHDEAVEVLKSIHELYPRTFEITKRRVKLLIPQLEKMDYEAVMEKLSNHVSFSPYPPALSDIAVYLPEENDYLDRICEWEKEAAEVPKETKMQFNKKLDELTRRMADDTKC
ncbi:hypothetical protein [Halobacillus mangrovi]|uniref:Replicative helicase inhibitor G39P N-terminal domain-containing protein n=1 Tax=Halobacillus mangrovi TaxID=402384 RepID=A0A1W5ZQU2_9BACI|nr:hypothetical protein [Halobacillus mangrovi]ARI75660.1 hypothetical protein HM131_01940 [Halobacillus mangrovi]